MKMLIISAVISILVFIIGQLFLYIFNRVGAIKIYSKIVGTEFCDDNYLSWGFNKDDNDKIILHIPVKFDFLNNKNIDYCIRDLCLYGYNDYVEVFKMQQIDGVGGEIIKMFGENSGDFRTYSFVLSKNSIKSFSSYFAFEFTDIKMFNFNKIVVSYYDIKGNRFLSDLPMNNIKFLFNKESDIENKVFPIQKIFYEVKT